MSTERESLLQVAISTLRRGVRVKRDHGRSWGFVSWLPLVIDFGYLRFNRHWWHNLHCQFAWVYRLHHGEWPTYWYWDKKLPVPCSGGYICHADTHIHGCFSDYGSCDHPEEHRRG